MGNAFTSFKYVNNLIADSLSRPTCDEETKFSYKICFAGVDFPNLEIENIRQEPIEDIALKTITQTLKANDVI